MDPRVERTMRLSVIEGSLTMAFINWTSGAVLTGYMLHHGARPLELALIGSLPMLAGAASPLAAWVQSRYPRPRRLTTVFAALSRVVWLLPALAPLLMARPQDILVLTLAVAAISHLSGAVCGVIWTGWMGTVVPQERRGRYFGFRNGVHAMVGLAASLLAGVFLDALPSPYNYQVMLGLAVLLAALGINMYRYHYEPPQTRPLFTLKGFLHEPFSDRKFRGFLLMNVWWQSSVFLAAPFVFPYYLDQLGLLYLHIALYQSVAAVTTLVASPFWGRLSDRVGNRGVLGITTVLAGSLLPACWILAEPGDPTLIIISGLVDGIAWGGIGPAMFNLMLASAPEEKRLSYIGGVSLLAGLGGFAAALAGAGLLNLLVVVDAGSFVGGWSEYQLLFVISGVMRCMTFLLIRQVEETHAWRTREVIRLLLTRRGTGFFWR